MVQSDFGWRFDAGSLTGRGFEGFEQFGSLSIDGIPRGAGVYVVLRGLGVHHRAVSRSVGGWFKGKDPTVDSAIIAQRLLCPSETLYIGKADSGANGRRGLQKRIAELARFGEGRPVGHWGGRYLWQLSNSNKLRIAWLEVGEGSAGELENELLTEFAATFGQLPFANLRH